MNKIYNGIILQGIHIKKQWLLNYYSYQAITVYSEILHSQTVTLAHTRIKGVCNMHDSLVRAQCMSSSNLKTLPTLQSRM